MRPEKKSRIRSIVDRIVASVTGPETIATPEPRPWTAVPEPNRRAIVTIGGSTGYDVMRGDVLIVDLNEIDADPQGYGGDTLAELHRIRADEGLIADVKAAIEASGVAAHEQGASIEEQESAYQELHARFKAIAQEIGELPPQAIPTVEQMGTLGKVSNALKQLAATTTDASIARRIEEDREQVRKVLGIKTERFA